MRFLSILLILVSLAVAQSDSIYIKQVTVTAYSSRQCETDSSPFIAAWGDSVAPGTIAVSRDLLEHLDRGQKVWLFMDGRIDTFTVNDKMNKRWKNRIDIWLPDSSKAMRFEPQHEVDLIWSDILKPALIIMRR